MVLHGLSHDIGYFVVATIVNHLHGMEDAALNGFQTISKVRNGTLQNDVARLVEEPVLVHATQMVYLVV